MKQIPSIEGFAVDKLPIHCYEKGFIFTYADTRIEHICDDEGNDYLRLFLSKNPKYTRRIIIPYEPQQLFNFFVGFISFAEVFKSSRLGYLYLIDQLEDDEKILLVNPDKIPASLLESFQFSSFDIQLTKTGDAFKKCLEASVISF